MHLAESVRRCGPISLLAQWSMETYAGHLNRLTCAKSLFAQTTREKMKYQSAASLYSLRYNTSIPFIDDDNNSHDRNPNSCCRSSLNDLENYCFLHPAHAFTIIEAQKTLFKGLSKMMIQYYMSSYQLSEAEALGVLEANPNIIVWDRMLDEKNALSMSTIYSIRQLRNAGLEKLYFSAQFQ